MTDLPAPSAAPRFYALRMRMFFAGYFIYGGVVVPFFPVWLDFRGLTDVQIANVIAVPGILRVLLTPFAGVFADRAPNRRFAAIVFALPAAAVFLLAWPAESYLPILLVVAVSFTLYGLVLPPAEALALTGVRRFGLDYGRMRLGGSVAFIVANLAAGALLTLTKADVIFWLTLGALSFSTIVAFWLPVTPPALRALDDTARPRTAPMRLIFAKPVFLILFVVGGLTQASHAVFYSFGSLYWQRLGFHGVDIGIFWAISIACEVTLFMFSGAAVRLAGPLGLLALGAVAAMVRWSLFSLEPGFLGFAALQTLHGLTFAATYLGNQHAIARAVPEEATASAQGLFAMVVGLLMAGATFLAGPLYESLGSEAFLVMTIPPALALVLLGIYRVATRDSVQA